jgi:uncharacterized membrane protein YadS
MKSPTGQKAWEQPDDRQSPAPQRPASQRPVGLSEDWTATLVGLAALVTGLLLSYFSYPPSVDWRAAQERAAQIRQQQSLTKLEEENSLSESDRAALVKDRRKSMMDKLGISWGVPGQSLFAKMESWRQNPLDGLRKKDRSASATSPAQPGPFQWPAILASLLILGLIGSLAAFLRGLQVRRFVLAFPWVFALAIMAYLLAAQEVIKNYNFEYPLWGLFVGMLVCNTVGTPRWLTPAVQGELYIKIGLVLLGAEVLLSRLLALGIPGVMVSWVVTPIVLVGTYAFGQRILRISSRSLNMVISADMSVCGVSAAIATAAACKAKKEELSLAIGLSLTFTAIMMVVMPLFVKWVEMDPMVAGAWMGGTIDSTGAVVAAGETLGVVGSETAVTVKMIQNILIGVIALLVAVYWTRWVEPTAVEPTSVEPTEADSSEKRPASVEISLSEIWRRFPKFVLGFVAASILCSAISWQSFFGDSWIQTATSKLTVPLRGWLFCLAFICIGLSTNFRQLAPYLRSGKPLLLYVCGQAFNLILTLAMATVMFGWFYQWMTG